MPRGDRPTVALLGFGGAGSGIHAPLIAATDALELSVIVTRDSERQAAAAARFPAAHVTASVVDAERCDIAVVALPVAFRAEIVRRLLDRGIRVVVEKPFAADLGESRRLAAAAGERIAVFHNRRWDSDFLTLRRLQREKAWTGPVRLTSRIQRWQPTIRDGWRNRPDGGGFLREVATHQIDQALFLLGRAVSVYAEVQTARAGAAAEDEVFLSLRHLDGSRSHLISSAIGDASLPRFDLASPRTLISIGAADPQQDQVVAGMTPSGELWGMSDTSAWWIRAGDDGAKPLVAERGWWPGYYESVADWVSGGPPPVSAEDAVATMAVIDAARVSTVEGTTVLLEGR